MYLKFVYFISFCRLNFAEPEIVHSCVWLQKWWSVKLPQSHTACLFYSAQYSSLWLPTHGCIHNTSMDRKSDTSGKAYPYIYTHTTSHKTIIMLNFVEPETVWLQNDEMWRVAWHVYFTAINTPDYKLPTQDAFTTIHIQKGKEIRHIRQSFTRHTRTYTHIPAQHTISQRTMHIHK